MAEVISSSFLILDCMNTNMTGVPRIKDILKLNP